jgi:hypothetical protein
MLKRLELKCRGGGSIPVKTLPPAAADLVAEMQHLRAK